MANGFCLFDHYTTRLLNYPALLRKAYVQLNDAEREVESMQADHMLCHKELDRAGISRTNDYGAELSLFSRVLRLRKCCPDNKARERVEALNAVLRCIVNDRNNGRTLGWRAAIRYRRWARAALRPNPPRSRPRGHGPS